jgi:hypothetical protein
MNPARTKDSPRWCDHCQLWGDHHTDRHDPDRYKAHLESGLQSVVAANRELANHNLQEYRKVRDRLLEVYEVYEQALRVIAANTDTWQGEVAQKALETMREKASR